MASVVLLLLLFAVGLFLSLAHLAERDPWLRRLVIGFLALANLTVLAVGLLLVVTGLGLRVAGGAALGPGPGRGAPSLPPLSPELGPSAEAAERLLSQEGGQALVTLGVIAAGLAAVGLALLVTRVRGLVARLLPLDPQRVVHTVALHLALLLVGLSAAVALFLPLMARSEEQLAELSKSIDEGGLTMLWVQALGFVAIACLGVGWRVSRNARQTAERLGLERSFHGRWWLAATSVGLASSWGVDALWSRLQPETFQEVSRLSEAMFGPLLKYGLWGAVTIAVSAAIGEELLFRGAAQPRLGLWTTALLFMAVHTQYTVSLALLQVWIVGLLLGLVRRRANTSTAIGVHAAYNFVLVLIALYAPQLGP